MTEKYGTTQLSRNWKDISDNRQTEKSSVEWRVGVPIGHLTYKLSDKSIESNILEKLVAYFI